MAGLYWKIPLKSMMTGGCPPISGNHHKYESTKIIWLVLVVSSTPLRKVWVGQNWDDSSPNHHENMKKYMFQTTKHIAIL